MELKQTWQRFRAWLIQNYQEKSEVRVTDLVWLRRALKPGEKLNWSFVDTIDYQLDSLPKRRELIVDFKAIVKDINNYTKTLCLLDIATADNCLKINVSRYKPKEVSKKCPILLNWKKEK